MRTKIHVFTLAVPAVFVMDLISGAVDFPWWAYLFLVIFSATRLTYTRYYG